LDNLESFSEDPPYEENNSTNFQKNCVLINDVEFQSVGF